MYEILTVGPWADVKDGFTSKIIFVLKVRGGHGEWKFLFTMTFPNF